ncbi:MAG: HYR domain-containing protein, partial [Marinirhabdus sp.]
PPAFTVGENFNAGRCFIETFESFTVGDNIFTSNGVAFETSNANFDVTEFIGAGAGGSNRFLDNTADQGTGSIYTITTTGTELFTMNTLEVYLSSLLNGTMPTNDGSITLVGKLSGAAQYTITKNSGFPASLGTTHGFSTLNFATDGSMDHSFTNIDELEITLGGAFQYIAIDNFEHCGEIINSSPPIVQNIGIVGNPPASSNAVDFLVTFNEDAVNVTQDDFVVTATGTATGTISGISGTGTAYTVNVTGVSGEGSIRLDLLGNTDIEDTNGNTPPPPFTTGEIQQVTQCSVETFEAVAIDASSWTTNSLPFESTANLNVSEFVGAGAGNSDRYLDNITDQGVNKTYTISVTNGSTIPMSSMAIYLSSITGGTNPTNDGTLTIIGNNNGAAQYTIVKSTGFPTTLTTNNGFYTVDFSTEGGNDNSTTPIDELVITIGGAFQYVAVDNFNFCNIDPPPNAVCQDITVQLDSTGSVTITPEEIDNGSNDNSGTVTLVSVVPNTFDCSNTGTTNTVTLTVEDDMGQQATCTATVTVEDNIAPAITCPGDITVGNDAGTCGAVVTYAPPSGTDNCASATTAQTDATGLSSGDTFPVGATVLEYTVTDASGNTATCSFTVTVEDTEPPAAMCQDITVQLDGTGSVTITPADIDNGSSDNCGIAGLALDVSTFDCSTVGPNTVTLTVTDDSGNTSSCTATVTVEDTEPPVAMCQDITVQLDGTGSVTITPADIDNGSSDN